MKNILVTGSTGLIGNYLVNSLGKKTNIIALARKNIDNPNIRASIICNDLLNLSFQDISQIYSCYKITHVIHLAGLKKITNQKDFEFNASVIEKFLLADKDKKIHFIILGSISEYGIVNTGKITEDTPCNPISEYAKSKYAQTLLCEKYFKVNYKINVIRLTNPLLPKLPKDSFFGALIHSIKNKVPLYVNNLNIQRDFVDIRDFIQFIYNLIIGEYVPEVVLNFGSGINITYGDCLKLITRILKENNLENLLHVVSKNKDEVYSHSEVSLSTANIKFKYNIKHPIKETIEWLLYTKNIINVKV